MTSHTYSYNRQHLLRDGKPRLPAMGEFHFSRTPASDWREDIRLMRAGGVDVIATYTCATASAAEAIAASCL